MLKSLYIVVTFIGLSSLCFAEEKSLWDKGQFEFKKAVNFPIKYKTVFTREREMFGYKPRFMPGMINFTVQNSPVIRCGINPPAEPGQNHASFPSEFFSEKNYIQYLNAEDSWTTSTRHIAAIRDYLRLKPEEKLFLAAGERCADAIEFDKQGDAYTLVKTKYFKDGNRFFASFLLYSNNNLKTWQVYPLNGKLMRLEPYRPNSDCSKPPVVTITKSGIARGGITLVIPEKTKSGKLRITKTIRLVPDSVKALTVDTMAGAGSQCVSSKDKIFVVYMSVEALLGKKGTPQYIVSYDRKTGKIEGPLLLGVSGHRVDGHNYPVIDIDERGYLHVLGGTHWHGVPHWTSKKPNSISCGWTKPKFIAGRDDASYSLSGITYLGFIICKDGSMHLVARGRSSTLEKQSALNPRIRIIDYALIYFRKLPGKAWEKRRDLVVPAWKRYCNWYHKISIDRKGNLFLTYYYIALWLDQVPSAQKEYCKKWEKELNGKKTFLPGDVLAHDPVLISSEDNGISWKLTTTQDFINNLAEKN
jgi:hypothetical protein